MNSDDTREFKSFYETYKVTSISMTVGMIYPNPSTDRRRMVAIPIFLLTMLPLFTFMAFDMKRLWDEGDIVLFLRHIAMGVPLTGGFIKMCLMNLKRVEAKKILDIINHDYASYNSLPENYKSIFYSHKKTTELFVNFWSGCVLFVLLAFLGTASICNIVSYLFMPEPKLYMIYDVNIPTMEKEVKFETPYFEIMYIYTTYVSAVFAINFIGYDGLMLVSLNHVCLRQALLIKHLEDAMSFKGKELRDRITASIMDQIEILSLKDLIQATFNIYLGYMYVTVLMEIVICLYLNIEGFDFDFQFACLSYGAIVHIYIPCMIADRLKCSCEESAVHIYCCGWETMHDVNARRCIAFMIARAQQPAVLKAFGLLTYEMDLFVKTMKNAYSIYTLFKSQQINN